MITKRAKARKLSRTSDVREAFNAAIDFAITLDIEGAEFLRCWREGAWDVIAIEYPEFKGPICE